MEDQVEPHWRKSSYSGNGGGDCVEVALNLPSAVAVRDSKDPGGPILIFEVTEWGRFVGDVKAGCCDLGS